MTAKTCKACSIEKAVDEFDKNKTFPDGHESRCKACKKAGIKIRRGNGASSSARKASSHPPPRPQSRWARPAGFGFAVCLEVDEARKQTDIKLEQNTGDLGDQVIWLNQAEARELHSWLTEQLGDV